MKEILLGVLKNYQALSANFSKLISTNSCSKTTNSWYFSIKTCRKIQKPLAISSFLFIFATERQSREIILSRISRKEREAILQITKGKESSRYETVKIYSSRSINELHHYPLLLL